MAQAVISALAVLAVQAHNFVGGLGDVQDNGCEVVVAPGVGVDANHVGAADGSALAQGAAGGAADEIRWVDLGVGGAKGQLVLGVPCGLGHAAGLAGFASPLGVVAVDRVLAVVDRDAVPGVGDGGQAGVEFVDAPALDVLVPISRGALVPELAEPVELGVGGGGDDDLGGVAHHGERGHGAPVDLGGTVEEGTFVHE